MTTPTGRPCPICNRPSRPEDRPFCSPRCRDVDLGRWFSGAYAVPVADDEDEDGAPAGDAAGGRGGGAG